MEITLAIFSGLPGTGKSSLATRLARERRWPLLAIDDVAGEVPAGADFRFWDERIRALLAVVETQLNLGLSAIVDSVFMGEDRLHVQELARQYGAAFRPVYCHVSDEVVWEERVTKRAKALEDPAVATWERIAHQRRWFAPWQPGTALFVDALEPFESNYSAVREFVTKESVVLRPLAVDLPLKAGSYHDSGNQPEIHGDDR